MAEGDRPESATERFWDVQDISRRLHRVEGQVRGLEALVSRGARCEELLTQLRAVMGALSAVERIVEMCRTVERIESRVGELDRESVRRALMAPGGETTSPRPSRP